MATMTAPSAPPPLHLVLGDEELLVERAVRDVVDAARVADPEVELRRLRAPEATPADLAAALSPSLFAEARVVVLEAAHEAGKDASAAVLDHATAPGEGVTVVVLHAGGARNKALADALRKVGAQVVRCEKLRPEERADFVRAEVRRARGKITPDAVGVLIESVGTELRDLASAAVQLVADTGGAVDAAAVGRYYRGRAEASGFAVADKVVAGDRVGALEALRWALVLGVPPVLVADALADAVRTLAKVGGAGRGDPNRLAGVLGMPPWKIRKAQSQVRGWQPGRARGGHRGGGGGQCGRQGCGAGRRLRAGAGRAADVRRPGDPRLRPRRGHRARRRVGHADVRAHTETAPLVRSDAVGTRCVRGCCGSSTPSGCGVDPPGHRRLAVRRLVLVDDALAGRLVEGLRGGALQLGGLLGVARLDGLAEAADGGADGRADRLVALPALLVRLDPLDLGLDVGHANASSSSCC